MAIGYDHQKKIQQQLFLAQGPQKAIANKSMGHKTEAALDLSDSVRIEDLFFDHGRPLTGNCTGNRVRLSIES